MNNVQISTVCDECIQIRKVDDNEGNDMISFPPDKHERPKLDFVCFTCSQCATCLFAYHWYNVDDCFALK